MNISYTKVGDYLLPNRRLKEVKQHNIGKYELLKLKYLKEHNKGLYTELLHSKDKDVDKLLEYSKIFNIYEKVNTIVEVMMKW